MTLEKIQADMIQGLEQNRKAVIEKDPSKAVAFDKAVRVSMDAIRSADDKDLLLMSEKANLQSLMTSENYLFMVTRDMTKALAELQTCAFHDLAGLRVRSAFRTRG